MKKTSIVNCLLVNLCFVVSFLSCSTGTIRSLIISDEQEIELGQQFKAEILRDTINYPRFRGDTAVTNYVNRLGQKIAEAQNDRDTLAFSFTVIDDTLINAFAIPGGHVFLYTGLLKAAKNTEEVAGVLAHEIGHITMFHSANRLAGVEAVNLVTTILFGSDSTSIAAAVTNVVAGLTFLKFSRKDEYQADSCSVAYTTASNFNPVGMKSFLQTLVDLYGGSLGTFEQYSEPFSTHPQTTKRIDEVERIINKTPGALTVPMLPTSELAVIKSKL